MTPDEAADFLQKHCTLKKHTPKLQEKFDEVCAFVRLAPPTGEERQRLRGDVGVQPAVMPSASRSLVIICILEHDVT